jgi:hypothetical protein
MVLKVRDAGGASGRLVDEFRETVKKNQVLRERTV